MVTDITGASARDMLRALLNGETDPAALATLARGKLRAKQAQLEQALAGTLREHHRFLLRELLDHLEYLVYHILTSKEPYRDLGPNYYDELDRQALERRLVRRLERLGNDVQLQRRALDDEAERPTTNLLSAAA